jgi:hypothetical protein
MSKVQWRVHDQAFETSLDAHCRELTVPLTLPASREIFPVVDMESRLHLTIRPRHGCDRHSKIVDVHEGAGRTFRTATCVHSSEASSYITVCNKHCAFSGTLAASFVEGSSTVHRTRPRHHVPCHGTYKVAKSRTNVARTELHLTHLLTNSLPTFSSHVSQWQSKQSAS